MKTLFHQEPLRRFWLFSDLQQHDPTNARICMHTGVEDFLSLDLPVDAVCYLGDSTEWIEIPHLEEMAEMQVKALARIDAPIYYVMGNHELDYQRRGPRSRPAPIKIPMRERILRENQWHTTASPRDWTMTADFDGLTLFFFSDHGDPDGYWCDTHGYVQDYIDREGGEPPHQEGDEEEQRIRATLASIETPFFTLSHYAYAGGNRESPQQSRFLPLPGNAIAHFYGHCHIGDEKWGGDQCLRQIAGIAGSSLTQFDIASLENRRGNAIRSAIVEWYGGRSYGVFFRDHTAKRWDKVYLDAGTFR